MIIEYLPPSNELESKLAQLWQESLGIETIGGHSLKAINLMEKINKSFNCNLPATQIYRDPTIRQLCSTILNNSETPPSHESILLKKNKNTLKEKSYAILLPAIMTKIVKLHYN